MFKKLLGALAAAILFSASGAHAAPVTWNLQNWVFDDGGTASGSFVFDADTRMYSNIAVVTTDGSVRAGASYHVSNLTLSGAGTAGWLTDLLPDFTNTPAIVVDWANSLAVGGGTVDVKLTGLFHFETRCASVICNSIFVGRSARNIISGSVTTAAVPLPASLPLVGLGLLMLSAVRRRR